MIDLALCRKLLPYALAGAVLIIGAAGCYEAGYRSASRKYEVQIAADKLAQSQALAAAQAEARKKEKESAERLSEALAERDKALARAESVRRDAVRVREQSGTIARSLAAMSAAHAASGDSVRERLGRCESLLAESAGLLGESVDLAGEGAELSIRIAADKDAVVNSIQPIN